MKFSRIGSTLLAVPTLLASSPLATAEELRIPLPDGTPVQRIAASYACAGTGTRTATYINADGISLLLLPVEGRPMVFANVLAASGARYAAGPFIWWEHGSTATLTDIRQGENAPPLDTCTRKD